MAQSYNASCRIHGSYHQVLNRLYIYLLREKVTFFAWGAYAVAVGLSADQTLVSTLEIYSVLSVLGRHMMTGMVPRSPLLIRCGFNSSPETAATVAAVVDPLRQCFLRIGPFREHYGHGITHRGIFSLFVYRHCTPLRPHRAAQRRWLVGSRTNSSVRSFGSGRNSCSLRGEYFFTNQET